MIVYKYSDKTFGLGTDSHYLLGSKTMCKNRSLKMFFSAKYLPEITLNSLWKNDHVLVFCDYKNKLLQT